MKIHSAVAALGLMIVGVPAAHAAVLINTFGPGDAFVTTGGTTVSLFQNVGIRFVPAAAAMPTDITVAMKAASPATITLSICVDANGHPGAALASTTVSVPSTDPQVLHAVYANPAALTAGVTYWVKAVPASGSGSATWMPNSSGATGYSATLASGAWNAVNGITPALRLEDNSTPSTGACCAGTTCTLTLAAACTGPNHRFAGASAACNSAGNATVPCCKADFNQVGGVSVQDIFDFLGAYFSGDPLADINGGGASVQDIFDFLAGYFAGCA
jgi:hypothetical protein